MYTVLAASGQANGVVLYSDRVLLMPALPSARNAGGVIVIGRVPCAKLYTIGPISVDGAAAHVWSWEELPAADLRPADYASALTFLKTMPVKIFSVTNLAFGKGGAVR